MTLKDSKKSEIDVIFDSLDASLTQLEERGKELCLILSPVLSPSPDGDIVSTEVDHPQSSPLGQRLHVFNGRIREMNHLITNTLDGCQL